MTCLVSTDPWPFKRHLTVADADEIERVITTDGAELARTRYMSWGYSADDWNAFCRRNRDMVSAAGQIRARFGTRNPFVRGTLS